MRKENSRNRNMYIKSQGRSVNMEIKVEYSSVESQISNVKGSLQGLKAKSEGSIEGNVLDTADKLNELASKLDTILASYKGVLEKNLESTRQAVESMREADATIAGGMQRK